MLLIPESNKGDVPRLYEYDAGVRVELHKYIVEDMLS